MTRYLAKKLVTLLLLLGLVSITVFSVLFVLPGDPAQIILGINATPETLATLRAELGLDKPFLGQYLALDRHAARPGRATVHPLQDARVRADHGQPRGHRPDGAVRHGVCRPHLAAPGDLRRPAPEPHRGRDGHVLHPARARHPRVLVRDPADPAVFGKTRLVRSGRISRAGPPTSGDRCGRFCCRRLPWASSAHRS